MNRIHLGWAMLVAAALAGCGGGGGGLNESVGVTPLGPYSSTQYPAASIAEWRNVTFSIRSNPGGDQITSATSQRRDLGNPELRLEMDIYQPPNAGASSRQPLVVWVHGGGLVTGGKEDGIPEARSYARAGYVAASVNYRLSPGTQSTVTGRENAVRDAGEDVMNAVRFLKVNAARYGIDTRRIVMIGTSGGGMLSLINAVQYDTLDGTVSDFPGVSSKVNAAVSTGATLVGDELSGAVYLEFNADDTPVQIYHARPVDGSTGTTWNDSVVPTRQLFQGAGIVCETYEQPNLTHTVDLSLGGPYWADLRPFIFRELRLDALVN